MPGQGATTAVSAGRLNNSFQPPHNSLSLASSSGRSLGEAKQAAAPLTAYFVYV